MTCQAVLEVLGRCSDRGIQLTPLAPDRLRVEAPTGTLTDDLRRLLVANKLQLLEVLANTVTNNRSVAQDTHRAAITAQAATRGYALADLERIAEPDDWPDLETDSGLIEELLDALDRLAGRVPPSYTEQVECAQCGPVWLRPGSRPGKRLPSCVWCVSRVTGRPVPRP